MKSHPILFRPDMVRATLNCKPGIWPAEALNPAMPFKWQTRRVVKPQPLYEAPWYTVTSKKPIRLKNGVICSEFKTNVLEEVAQASAWVSCPYGVPGEELWVRETFQPCSLFYDDYSGGYEAGYPLDHIPEEQSRNVCVFYAADGITDGPWRPSIHMPRWACRLHLENRGVRVGRVQDITEADAFAEGISGGDWLGDPVGEFAKLWNSINAKPKPALRNPYTHDREKCKVAYPWESVSEITVISRKASSWHGCKVHVCGNPFVWIPSFMRMEEKP